MTDLPTEALPEAFFLEAETGQRFCLFHRAHGNATKGRLLYLHPFAEEMNASRRVVAQQCRALAASGYSVLQIDLLGCGDSSGDFADATWQHWLDDARLGVDWLEHNTDQQKPLWLWGLRAGALLACETARHLADHRPELSVNLLLWQPVASGQQQLQQFLRLHAAAQWLGRHAAGEPPAQALAAGRHAHVAGYSLSPTMAAELQKASPHLPAGQGRIVLIELHAPALQANAPVPTLSPGADRQRGNWQIAGWRVNALTVGAAPFWQNVVESDLPAELDRATRHALSNGNSDSNPP